MTQDPHCESKMTSELPKDLEEAQDLVGASRPVVVQGRELVLPRATQETSLTPLPVSKPPAGGAATAE